jgi:gamma-glutamyltranspeptidase/glutathione hydrolase
MQVRRLPIFCAVVITFLLASRAPTQVADPLLNQGPKAEAVGEQAMVSTQLPAVTKAAVKVLREGGNAVDAFVTAVLLQHVEDFHQVSHFGAMSGIYYEAETGTYHAFNAFSERPDGVRCEHGDPAKVAIGGTVRGLESLAERFGTKPWASYFEPAIEAAERGVLVTSFMYRSNYSLWERSDWIKSNEQARRFYMPEGHLVPVGRRWKMPMLAETLRKVASEGADYLYRGAWGQKFVKEANKRGGCVSMEDMAAYETRWMEPARFTYRGHEIIVEPPPNKGGLLVGQNLNVLENFDLKGSGHYAESADTLEIMVRSFGKVESDMRWSIQDPLTYHNPFELWTSKDYAKMSAEYVRNTMVRADVDLSPSVETAADRRAARPLPVPDLGSNHDVIVDGDGNWITSLHTGHGGAAGVFIDGVRATGSGVRAETNGPGRRILAEVTGVFVVKDGKPWLSLGTPGFPPQPVTEVLVNILDFEMHPKDAADAPRFWAFLDEKRLLRIESRITEAVRKGMASRGIKMEELGDYNWHTGSMQIIWRDPRTGKLHGVTDPRRLGHAAGF